MGRLLACLSLGLAACSSEPPAPADDLPAIKQLRSAAAEWALVNREAARGRLTRAYADGMRDAAREEIASGRSALKSPSTPAPAEAAALLALPERADPSAIASHAARLKALEDRLEPS